MRKFWVPGPQKHVKSSLYGATFRGLGPLFCILVGSRLGSSEQNGSVDGAGMLTSSRCDHPRAVDGVARPA